MSEYEMEKFEESIREKIYSVRGFQVMLDFHLAELYEVKVKRLNEQVKRNIDRFPAKFCFRLSENDMDFLRSQLASAFDDDSVLRSQIATAKKGGRTNLPYAFTEQGVAMLAGVLKSGTAVRISIMIIEAFVEMRKFIHSNAQVFQRLDRMELKQIETSYRLDENDKKFDKIFSLMESGEIKPKQGILFDKQVFDAYKYVSDIVKSAEKSILIIDNYVDDSVLTILSKRKKGVKASIYTKNISAQLKLDVKKFNEQYEPVEIVEFDNSHDRFIVIDEKVIYHFGASLKDLGKKWFGFSKMEVEAVEMLSRLGLRKLK
ncbi:MAG: ORF6N domain-containing protein [Candidatus Delongbacteria bacterium]|nr:ORF6N domain-containing protein [Candidatus Delongbacteria bacterium]